MIRPSLLASLLLFASASAAAQDGVTVVVEADASDPLARRLRAELGARGYVVSALESPALEADAGEVEDGEVEDGEVEDGEVEIRERADDALGHGVGGYARVERESTVVCARRAHDGALRCERIDRAVGDDIAALQIVELLRARLLGASPPREEEPAEDAPDPPPPPVLEPVARPPARIEVEVTLGATIPIDGTTPSLDSRVAIGVAIDPSWSIRVWGRLPWIATRAEAPEGAADLSARLVGVEGALAIPLDALLAIELAAFVAGGWLEASGEAMASDDASITAGLFLGGLHAALSVSPLRELAVIVRASAGWSAPTPVIQFGAREVARWGAPWIAIDLGLRALAP